MKITNITIDNKDSLIQAICEFLTKAKETLKVKLHQEDEEIFSVGKAVAEVAKDMVLSAGGWLKG